MPAPFCDPVSDGGCRAVVRGREGWRTADADTRPRPTICATLPRNAILSRCCCCSRRSIFASQVNKGCSADSRCTCAAVLGRSEFVAHIQVRRTTSTADTDTQASPIVCARLSRHHANLSRCCSCSRKTGFESQANKGCPGL